MLSFFVEEVTDPVVRVSEKPCGLDTGDHDADVDEYYADREEKYVGERAKDVFVAGAMGGGEKIGRVG